MVATETAIGWIGRAVESRDGGRVGKLDGLLIDGVDYTVTWFLVRLGMLRGRHVVTPPAPELDAAGLLWLPADRAAVESAPEHQPRGTLTPFRESLLAQHYRLPPTRGARLHGAERRAVVVLVRNEFELANVKAGRRPDAAPERRSGMDRRQQPRLYAAALADGTVEYPPGRVPPPRSRGERF